MKTSNVEQFARQLYDGSLKEASLISDVYALSNDLVNSAFFEFSGKVTIKRIEHPQDIELKEPDERWKLYELVCGPLKFRFVPRPNEQLELGDEEDIYASVPISTQFYPLREDSINGSKEYLHFGHTKDITILL